jgi:hypothetical protein
VASFWFYSHPQPHCAHTHCLFFVNVQQASIDVMWCNFFCFAWRTSVTHLCFVRISMPDAILPDCSSAAICRTATELTNYLWVGSPSTSIPPAYVYNVLDQHTKIGNDRPSNCHNSGHYTTWFRTRRFRDLILSLSIFRWNLLCFSQYIELIWCPETGTSSVCWAHLNRFHLKT